MWPFAVPCSSSPQLKLPNSPPLRLRQSHRRTTRRRSQRRAQAHTLRGHVLAVPKTMSNTPGSRATAVGFGICSDDLGMLLGLMGILVGASFIAVGLRMCDDPTTPIVHAAFVRVSALILAFLHRNLAVMGLVMASFAVTAIAGGEAGPVLCFAMLPLFLLGLCFVHIHVLEKYK
ncbi:hypothetical protein QOZ80_8BG0647220 [Eleusine coracana subsp. coracana]|nr:hypothetical protein QOZ80_8BG0647220 [Eleusine coracana subsp. coracana]